MRVDTTSDPDRCFGNVKMFRKKFNKSGVSLAVMRLSTKINSKLIWGGFDDFFLGAAGFDGD